MTANLNKAGRMTVEAFIEKVQSLFCEEDESGALRDSALKKTVDLALKNPLPNFWNIIEYGMGDPGKGGKSAHETRYSRMLRWLLDPSENHNCGNYLARKLFEEYGQLPEREEELEHSLDILFAKDESDRESLEITTEWEKVDVSYRDKSHNLFIGIEVKQYAPEQITGEGDYKISQLAKYSEAVKAWHEGDHDTDNSQKPPKRVLLYLTPLKDVPTVGEWIPLSYRELIEFLRPMVSINSELNFVKILRDFIHDLERVIALEDYERNSGAIRETVQDDSFYETLVLFFSAIDPEEAQQRSGIEKFKEDELELARREFNEVMHQRRGEFHRESIIKAMEILFNSRSIQNHAPSDAVQRIIRRIFQELTCRETPPSTKESKLTENIALKEVLDGNFFKRVSITRGKGQGLRIHTDYQGYDAYISGGNDRFKGMAIIPNDGFRMLVPKNTPKDSPLRPPFESGMSDKKRDANELVENTEQLNQFVEEVICGLKKISEDFWRVFNDEKNREFREAIARIKNDDNESLSQTV